MNYFLHNVLPFLNSEIDPSRSRRSVLGVKEKGVEGQEVRSESRRNS